MKTDVSMTVRPCPFCNLPDNVDWNVDVGNEYIGVSIVCHECQAAGPEVIADSNTEDDLFDAMIDAAGLWNERPGVREAWMLEPSEN